jgi:hypothetical protein
MNSVIRVDADQIGVEGRAMSFIIGKPFEGHRLTDLLSISIM